MGMQQGRHVWPHFPSPFFFNQFFDERMAVVGCVYDEMEGLFCTGFVSTTVESWIYMSRLVRSLSLNHPIQSHLHFVWVPLLLGSIARLSQAGRTTQAARPSNNAVGSVYTFTLYIHLFSTTAQRCGYIETCLPRGTRRP